MPSWTAEQERAITEKGNLLVSAAAGAGKTAVMTERIARLIAQGTSVRELLVVTFTNAAAAEMKQRIEQRLTELADMERDETVRLPVRVNFGGGWSDTPPYCMENGGTVLNAAISFGGKLPATLKARRK